MFYLFKKNSKFVSAGFTLIEMIVVVGIFAVVTAIVLFNIPNFKESGSLDLVAQQIATYIRGAQVYGQSSYLHNGVVYPAYGIHLESNVSDFFLFADKECSPSEVEKCKYNATNDQKIENYKISSEFSINKIYCDGSPCPAGSSSGFDIVFRRPRQEAYFSLPNNSIAVIEILSSRTGRKKCVEVHQNGQIAVRNPNGANCI